jgi:hypothetical protein
MKRMIREKGKTGGSRNLGGIGGGMIKGRR